MIRDPLRGEMWTPASAPRSSAWSRGALAAFVISFGIAKSLIALVAGALTDRISYRRVLLLGWLLGPPITLLLMSQLARGWVDIGAGTLSTPDMP